MYNYKAGTRETTSLWLPGYQHPDSGTCTRQVHKIVKF